MGDFLSELFDQFDQEEQARIREAEASAERVIAQGIAVLQPEDDARADAAGVVFVAYVNALWRGIDPARAECIHAFLAKVDQLIDPVLTSYGWKGKGLIDALRWQCQMHTSIVHSLLRTSTASTTPSTVDSAAISPHDGTDHASGHADAADATEQSETERGQSGGADGPVTYVKPPEILDFSSDSWRKRKRQNADLNAAYARHRGRDLAKAARHEERLREARYYARKLLPEAVSDLQLPPDPSEADIEAARDKVRDRVVLPAWEKFFPRKRKLKKLEAALWTEEFPSLQDLTMAAIQTAIRRGEPGESRLANDPHRGVPPDGGPQAAEEPGSSDKLGSTEMLKAPARPGDPSRLTACPPQGIAEGVMPDNPFSDPEINDQIKAKILRLQAASLEWDDNPAGRGFDDHIVETLVETLDAHAEPYLRKVDSEDLISQYCEYLRGVGSVLIRNAEQRSFLSDPYSEVRLREMAENSGSLMNRILFLEPEERESEIQSEVERLRAEFMPKAVAWHQWRSQIPSRIEARFEASYRRWEADAIERPRNRGTPGTLKTPPDETATQKPTGLCKWDEVEIFVPNEFEAQIVLPNRPSRTRGFEDMGFADRRGKGAKKPNTLWDLLLAFARLKGRIENPKQAGLSDWRTVEQRVWSLNQALKRHFDIPDSPIRYINKGYESIFKIKADPFLDL